MQHFKRSGFADWAGMVGVLLGLLISLPAHAQTNNLPEPVSTTVATNYGDALAKLSAEQARILAELQTQQLAALKQLELTRKEIADSIAANYSNNLASLATVSEMINQQRQQDLKIIRDTHRVSLAIVVGLSGLLLLSILILNLTSIRAINRMTTMFSATSLMPGSEAQALADAREATRQLLLFPGEQGQRQLGNALVQLHSRIESLEKLATKLKSDTAKVAATESDPKAQPDEEPSAAAAKH